jgi:hypothetical protein
MSPLPLGILAASGAAAGGVFDLLETKIVPNNSTSVLTFSGLNAYASSYQHLMFRVNAKAWDGHGVGAVALRIYMNGIGGDDGGNTSYATHEMYHLNNSGQDSNSYSSIPYGFIGRSSAQFGNWTSYVVEIMDPFETTKNTTVRSLSGTTEERFGDFRASNVFLQSALFNNTAAITSISFQHNAGWYFASNSRFSLYGLAGA